MKNLCLCVGILAAAAVVSAATYEVGPGKAYTKIGQVPWASLQAGDTVLIYWSSTPYYEKWVINRQGTASAPITVRGVPNSSGQLPVIDGNGAVTAPNLAFWNQTRGIIKIGGSTVPADGMPQYITIENLEVRGARNTNKFTASDGTTQRYDDVAASIYVEKGQNITIRHCTLHDSGNGVFASSGGMGLSQHLLLEANYIYGNGNVNSGTEHNVYTSALGITFQYNHFGPLIAGSYGENLKDRSAGTLIRYNWIEGGNHELDLVDAANDSVITTDPGYRQTFVYGNILIEPMGDDNYSIVHYGGDQANTSYYRKGTLYFYNNTVVSTRTDHTAMFRPATNDENVDASNNIFYATAGGSTVSIAEINGVVAISHNWAQPGWAPSYGLFNGVVTDDGSMVTAASPAFANEGAQDYRLTSVSNCVNAGAVLNAAALPSNNVVRDYVKHQSSETRPSDGVLDIGAYEYVAGLIIIQPPSPSFTPIRVNAGGSTYTDSTGIVWSADNGYSGGSTYSTTAGIANTSTPALYQTERLQAGTFFYQFAVPAGSYTVRLKFAEIWFTRRKQRVFNVSINGAPVLSKFDIVAAAGKAFTAVDKVFPVSAGSGQITIQFTGVVQNPQVNAIEILASTNATSTSFSPIRVDAGGGAYTDSSGYVWSADYGYSGSNTYATSSFIANTTTPVLYQSERYQPGGFSYQFTVPSGSYTVRLKFAEIWFTQSGQRVFNVSINGQQVLSNFDVVAAAGAPFTAIDKAFTVNATSGQIQIQFSPVVENPKVSAIEIF